jgi:hypothetical protein
MTTTKNLIETVHSKWGIVKLEARMEIHINNYREVCFYYPSGKFMGGWDDEGGGALGHPNEAVEQFLGDTGLFLLNIAEKEYIELEELIEKEVDKFFPGFLKKPEGNLVVAEWSREDIVGLWRKE